MSQAPENIHTTFDQLLNRADKEQMLKAFQALVKQP
jgi:hypothetical protein